MQAASWPTASTGRPSRVVPPASADLERVVDNVFDFAEHVIQGQRRMVKDMMKAVNEQVDRAPVAGRRATKQATKHASTRHRVGAGTGAASTKASSAKAATTRSPAKRDIDQEGTERRGRQRRSGHLPRRKRHRERRQRLHPPTGASRDVRDRPHGRHGRPGGRRGSRGPRLPARVRDDPRAPGRRSPRGLGPVLLLLHGIAGSSLSWVPVMARLRRDFTVVAPDFVGHGHSAKPSGDYSLGNLASWTRDLLEILGIDRATVVGQSYGGGVALQFAYQFPERCERLVLVDSGGLGRDVNWVLRLVALPGADLVMPFLFPSFVGNLGDRVAGFAHRLGVRNPSALEIWRSYRSLTDAETRQRLRADDPLGHRARRSSGRREGPPLPGRAVAGPHRLGRGRPHHPRRPRVLGPRGAAAQPPRDHPRGRPLPPVRGSRGARRTRARVRPDHRAVRPFTRGGPRPPPPRPLGPPTTRSAPPRPRVLDATDTRPARRVSTR